MADAYVDGLRWLGRRELSVRQVRERLEKAGYDLPTIDAAIKRLVETRALDDRRVAHAFARTHILVKGRGPDRVRRELGRIGIEGEAVDAALREALSEVGEGDLLRRALARKAPHGMTDPRTRRRVYAALIRQGFSHDAVLAALRRSGGQEAD